MSDKSNPEFVLVVPGQSGRLRVSADRADYDGENLILTSGSAVVAVSSPQGLAVRSSSLLSPMPFPEPGLEPLSAASVTTFHGKSVPASWLFLSSLLLGLVVGIGATVSHLQAW